MKQVEFGPGSISKPQTIAEIRKAAKGKKRSAKGKKR